MSGLLLAVLLAAGAGALALGWGTGWAMDRAAEGRQPKAGTQYRVHCTVEGCSWGGTLDGPAHLIEGAAQMLAEGHTERRGHATKTERITR